MSCTRDQISLGIHLYNIITLVCLQPGRCFFHVGVDQRPDACLERVHHALDELCLGLDPSFIRAERRCRVDRVLDQRLDVAQRRIGAFVSRDVDVIQTEQATRRLAAGSAGRGEGQGGPVVVDLKRPSAGGAVLDHVGRDVRDGSR